MAASSTFLAAGQRYSRTDGAPWRHDNQITIVHVAHEAPGRASVTYSDPVGNAVTVWAGVVEAAIVSGQLAPVAGAGRLARC